jgi:hypothetical protein
MKEPVTNNSSQSVNCKREIVLKSIVTENFKIDLAVELKAAIENIKNQIQQVGAVIKQQKDKGYDLSQLENEQKKMAVQMKLMQDRLDEVKGLKVGTLYATGSVEGLSQLRIGDDIREKLGPIEVISKNYIIQEIHLSPKPNNTEKKSKPQISHAIKI